MNRMVTSLLLLTSSTYGFCQTINDYPATEINTEYMEIIGTATLPGSRMSIRLDFGEDNKKFKSFFGKKLRNKNGKKVKLDTMIDALNFMGRLGYEYVDAYTLTTPEGWYVYHYIMKKQQMP